MTRTRLRRTSERGPGSGLAMGAAALLVAGLMGAPADASATLASGKRIISSGHVSDAGRAISGVSVVVFARPTSTALDRAGTRGVRLIPLGEGRTDADGHFVVSEDLAALPATHVGDRGRVDVDIVVSDGKRSISWTSTAEPVSGSSVTEASAETRPDSNWFDLATGDVWASDDDPAAWVDSGGSPLGVGERTSADRKALVTSPAQGLLRFARSYLAADASTRRTMLMVGGAPNGRAAAVPGIPDPGGCGVAFWMNNYRTKVREHYLNVYSFSGAPVTVTEGTSGSTSQTLGVVAQVSGVSLSLGGTQTVSFSGQAVQTGLADASVSNRVNYRQQGVTCVSGTTWRPYSVYDFLTDFAFAPHINFANCQLHPAGYSWSTATATNVTYSAGVSFPGLNVSAQSGYGTSQRLTYAFKAAGYLCGNGSGPVSSSQLSARA